MSNGIVGIPGPIADGSESLLRLGTLQEIVISTGRARYAEGTSRNLTFSASTGGSTPVTIVAANVSPVAAAAATVLTIYNPIGSNVNAEILKTWLLATSGTPVGGYFVYNVANNQYITASPNNNQIANTLPQSNFSGITGKVKAFVQTALTGGSSAQALLRPIVSFFAAGVSRNTPYFSYEDKVEGDIIVPPGGLLTIAPSGTGTTVTLFAGMTWQETPLLL